MILEDTADVLITSEDGANTLEQLSITHRLPALTRMDNGPEPTCRALATWAEGIVDLDFISPREPWENGTSNRSTHVNQTSS